MPPAPPPFARRPPASPSPPARPRRLRAVLGTAALSLLLLAGLGALFVQRLVFADLPRPPDAAGLWSLNRPPGITFLDRTGAVIAVRGSRHGALTPLADLPALTPRAFLAAEDRRFYRHGAVDPAGTARALWTDLRAGRTAEGGSTLTQQLARTLFLGPEQTLKRKAQEAVLAVELERRLSKDAVLELYLNRIYFGAGAYGIEAASRTYFGHGPRELTLAESALLAALPKAPSRLDPASGDLDAARARARLVLASMRREGWITAAQERDAAERPARLSPPAGAEGDWGWALDQAAAEARALAGRRAPDLVVTLTLDPRLQPLAAAAVRDGVRQARALGAHQGALAALAPDGGVLALAGGLDHRDSAFNRATQALRQPGSAFKPLVYAAALEDGVAPDDVRTDGPTSYGGYAPRNFAGGYAGPVTVAQALARSINTVAVQLAHQVGTRRVAALARRFGLLSIPPDPRLPVALGAYEVRLLDLVSAFQVFQQGGVRRPPHLIERITSARGDPLWRWTGAQGARVYSQANAARMTAMLEAVVDGGTGRRADPGRPAAGKTGTTQNFRDAWFVGYTPDLAAGVWLGDDRGRPMAGVAGGDAPASTWARFVRAAEAGRPARGFADAPAEPGATADPRTGFYQQLARDLDAQAAAPEPATP